MYLPPKLCLQPPRRQIGQFLGRHLEALDSEVPIPIASIIVSDVGVVTPRAMQPRSSARLMTTQHPQRRDGTRNPRDADRDSNRTTHRVGRGVRRVDVRHPFACTLTEALQESRCESIRHRSVAFVKVNKSHSSGPSPEALWQASVESLC